MFFFLVYDHCMTYVTPYFQVVGGLEPKNDPIRVAGLMLRLAGPELCVRHPGDATTLRGKGQGWQDPRVPYCVKGWEIYIP